MSAAVARNLRRAACQFNQAMVKTRKSSPWRPIRRLTEALARRMVDAVPDPSRRSRSSADETVAPSESPDHHQTRSPPDMAVERTHPVAQPMAHTAIPGAPETSPRTMLSRSTTSSLAGRSTAMRRMRRRSSAASTARPSALLQHERLHQLPRRRSDDGDGHLPHLWVRPPPALTIRPARPRRAGLSSPATVPRKLARRAATVAACNRMPTRWTASMAARSTPPRTSSPISPAST